MEDNIQDFINSCDDMIKGKFIMADSKISKILETIAKNETLYNYINQCVNGYNFQKEYEKILNECDNGLYEATNDIEKNIAFVMCLFVEVDHHRMKFYDFISRFFRGAGAGNEYEAFVQTMLKPFKEAIISQYNINSLSYENTNITEEETSKEDDVYEQIINQLKILKNEVSFSNKISSKKKEEINIYLAGCIEAVKYKNKKLISALITALDKELKNVKPVRSSYNYLISLYLKIYA